MKNKLLFYLLSPFFLALAISCIIYLLIPKYNHQYEINLTKESIVSTDGFLYYYLDLDGDGQNEKILIKDYQDVPVVEIYNYDGTFINSWTQTGKRACRFQLMYGDYNQNGYLELYVFTEENDIIYLNWLEPLKNEQWISSKLPVCEINKVSDGCNYVQDRGGFSDLNQDGKKEIIFIINNGYGLTPRSLFVVDIYNKKIIQSPKSFSSIKGPIYIVDLDNDGLDEMMYQTGATSNIPIDSIVPYTDHSAWLMVLDNNLNFKFPPIEFAGDQKSLSTAPTKFDGIYQIVSLLLDARSSTSPQRLLVHSAEGHQIAEVELDGLTTLNGPLTLFPINTESESLLYILDSKNGNVYRLNNDYTLEQVKSYGERIIEPFLLDIDSDGDNEIMFYKYDSRSICFSDIDFNIICEAPLTRDLAYPESHVGLKNMNLENPLIYAQFGLEVFEMELIPIPFYRSILLFIGIYMGVFMVVFASQKVQSFNQKQKKKVEDRINELQLKSTLSQLDPHFTFNVINTISSNILNDNKEQANDYLVEFSRLLRRSLEFSDKVSWPLENEIEFVRGYLKLQQSRFGEIFDYKTEIDTNVKRSVQVPKMIVQGYVENAIKHGLRPKGEGGLLELKIFHATKSLNIEVKDNGIGRAASLISRNTSGTGKGMKLNEELVDLYNKLTNSAIDLVIEDLVDSDGRALGTSVHILIPYRS